MPILRFIETEYFSSMTAEITSAENLPPEDISPFLDEIIRVEKETWPEELQASREKMESRLSLFPQGFFTAKVENKIMGVSTSQISHYPSPAKTWDELTDNGFIKNSHNPSENALYVVSAGVSKNAQGMGIGGKLIDAQKDLARTLGLRYLFLGARIPGYGAYCQKHGDIPIEKYIQLKNEKGESLDPEIRFYQRRGLQVGGVKQNFEPDAESKDYGVLMVWENLQA